MAFKIIWAPSAILDLKDIVSFIAESSPENSVRFVQNIFQRVEQITNFPESGRTVPEFEDPGVREIIRKPCRII